MRPSTKPASASSCRSDRPHTAPAIQSDHSPFCATSSGVTFSCSKMSAIWRRPPGRRTRIDAASTAGLSGQRLKPSLEQEARQGVAHARVKLGTTDPDFPNIPLGGWAGTIRDVNQRSNPPIYLIERNRHTLDYMHPVYRKRCERDGLELESMWLGENDIEPDGSGPVAALSSATRSSNPADVPCNFQEKIPRMSCVRP